MPKYTADFNEDETGYVIRDLEGTVVDDWESEDEFEIKDLTREDVYSGWDYWNLNNKKEEEDD